MQSPNSDHALANEQVDFLMSYHTQDSFFRRSLRDIELNGQSLALFGGPQGIQVLSGTDEGAPILFSDVVQ